MSKRKKGKPKRVRVEHEWGECDTCGQHLPLVPETGMCGPCTFGEADTMFDTHSYREVES